MPRRKDIIKRDVLPDPMFRSKLAAKFVNCFMWDGKKSVAARIFSDALKLVEDRSKQDGFKMFKDAINNVKPTLEVKSRRVGGATYQVPVEVSASRRMALAMRWLIRYARQRKSSSMAERLASELLDAANNRGGAFEKKLDTHRMAEANKAFAHYRW